MLNHTASNGDTLATAAPPAETITAALRSFQIADRERRGAGRTARSRRRRWLALVVVVVLGAGGWTAWSRQSASNVPEVETYTFTGKAPRHVLLDLTGSIVPRTRIIISPQVGGVVARVHLPPEGQKVNGGDLLLEIEDARFRADYLQAEAGLAVAKAQLLELENGSRPEEIEEARAVLEQAKEQASLMKEEWQRTRKVFTSGAVARSELDTSYTLHFSAQKRLRAEQAKYDMARIGPRQERIAAARAEVLRAQAMRDRSKYFYDQTKIYAPPVAAGKSFTLLEQKVSPGESIQADLTYTALCTLADLSQMEAEIDVQEGDLAVLKIGGPCEVIPDAYPNRVYRGRVNRKQPLVNRQRGVVQVKVTIDHPDEYLLPNMNARILLLRDSPRKKEGSDLPEIPVRALLAGNDLPAVFLVDGQQVRLRCIEIGETLGENVQVRKGLQPEDRVILPGDRPLQDGQAVRVRGATPSAVHGAGAKEKDERNERGDRS